MYHFIVNPHSRSKKGQKLWNEMQEYLKENKLQYKVHLTEYTGHAGDIISNLTKDNTEKTIFLLGGDGTLNEMINGIQCFEHLTIGYIPTGSANDFARAVELNEKPLILLKRFIEHPRKIGYYYGLACLDNTTTKRFLVSSGIGFDAAVCKEAMNSRIKNVLNFFHLGKLTYLIIAVKQIMQKKIGNGSLSLPENKTIPFNKLIFCSAHNTKYEGGGFMFCPNADPALATLDYCLAESISRRKVLLTLPAAQKGNHTKVKGIFTGTGESFTLTTDCLLPVHTDGEYVGDHSSVTFSLSSNTLDFLY